MKTLICSLLLIPTLAFAASEQPPLGDADRARLERGKKQVASMWRACICPCPRLTPVGQFTENRRVSS